MYVCMYVYSYNIYVRMRVCKEYNKYVYEIQFMFVLFFFLFFPFFIFFAHLLHCMRVRVCVWVCVCNSVWNINKNLI